MLRFTLLFSTIISLLSVSRSEPLRYEHDYAVFFAVDSYEDKNLGNLNHSISNAKKIAQVLRDDYDFNTTLVENPSLTEINNKIDELKYFFLNKKNNVEQGQLLLYFTGHGKVQYFIPSNGKGKNLEESALNYEKLRIKINEIPCKHILVILDACYSVTFDPNFPYKGKTEFGRPGEFSYTQKFIDRFIGLQTRFFITSDAENKVVPDHSPFANAFFKGLQENKNAEYTALQLFADHLDKVSPRAWIGTFGDHQNGHSVFFSNKYSSSENSIKSTQNEAPNDYQSNMKLIGRGTLSWKRGSEQSNSIYVADFYLAANELTFAEFDAFCKDTNRKPPSDNGWGRGNRPVINVDWYDAIEYCNWLSIKEKLQPVYNIDNRAKDTHNLNLDDEKKWTVTLNTDANGYRLPTEVEWEYAARQKGKENLFGNGTNIAKPEHINFNAKDLVVYVPSLAYRKKTEPGKSFAPNSLGLYDLSGNVWEWCWDWYLEDKEFYANSKSNPVQISGYNRVIRGGSWREEIEAIKTTFRNSQSPHFRSNDLGFRLARSKN